MPCQANAGTHRPLQIGDRVAFKPGCPMYKVGARTGTVASTRETFGDFLRRQARWIGMGRRQFEKMLLIPPGGMRTVRPVVRLDPWPGMPEEAKDHPGVLEAPVDLK